MCAATGSSAKVAPVRYSGLLLFMLSGLIGSSWSDTGLAEDSKRLSNPPAGKEHWAFRPLRRPRLPRVSNVSWLRTPVDAFIAARHEQRGIRPAPEAPPAKLARRVKLDLTGLPPTAFEVREFAADASPNAYERFTEKLLASPQYGERWGRHWLDVARWADSEGYEENNLRPYAWRYRDYVVQSFNDDKPYDWFLRQQVAGDELIPYSDENLIATGFLAAARYSANEEDKAIQRNDVLVDITNATASALLGLTLSCAQCHDHKLEPLTLRDYYRFQGFFVQGQVNNLLLKDAALWRQYETAVPPELHVIEREQTQLVDRVRERLLTVARAKKEEERKLDDETVRKAFSPEELKEYDGRREQLKKLREKLPDKPQTIGFYSPASPTSVDVLPMKAAYPLPYDPQALRGTRPRLLARGDVHRPGEELSPAWPGLFGTPENSKPDKSPRTALADWLASRDNPLTARVWVNRVWQYHFGRGLCPTPDDFGLQGQPPTHPELLDWLAVELIESGWSTKHLQRLIVNSATYRQAAGAADPSDYAAWTPRRLEAEALRDSLLAVSGELDLRMGGKAAALLHTDKAQNELSQEAETGPWRRTLYLEHRRDMFHPFHRFFDGATANESCARRHVSTIPLQPLFLLNSEFMGHRAEAFAKRVEHWQSQWHTVDERDKQIAVAFELALSRTPTQRELEVLSGLLTPPTDGNLVTVCHVLFNLNEFAYID
jgi:hypothetical protein